MVLSLDVLFFLQILLSFSRGDLIVETKNGLVLGKEATTRELGKSYYSFKGIPYAKPPIGNLRFRAPVPSDNWTETYQATSEGNICLQDGKGSEDCLYLNIYTPKSSSNSSNLLPVMVWIYGGAFIHGESTYTTYGPDHFLDEDVVFVSLNYRLGVFGFYSTEDEAAYGNWGLKDQILALKWVQDNIEGFGGDKNKVTIFGESAGAVSVSLLLQSPLTENLFQRAIMQSGSSLNLWGLCRAPRDVSFVLGSLLQIETNNSTELTEKLREVDAHELLAASSVVYYGGMVATVALSGSVFAPTKEPEHEGAVVIGPSHENLKNGKFIKVPVIIGFTSQEGLLLADYIDIIRIYLLTLNLLPDELIPIDINLSDPSLISIVSNEISTKYFGANLENLTNENLIQYTTDDQFARPINEAARLMSQWVPTYYYRFSFKESGVPHAGELPIIFTRPNQPSPSDLDILTRKRIIKLWTNFARTSNPLPAQNEELFGDVVWETYSEKGNFLDIGRSVTTSSNIEEYSISWWKSIFDKYGNPPFDTF